MTSLLFRLVFWKLMIAIGSQTGYGIYKMRDKMRELTLKRVAEPWPQLEAVPPVDHTVNPYLFRDKHKKKK